MPELSVCIAKMVGARLRELRLDAELTQVQVADRTGIRRRMISHMEQGDFCPALSFVARYAAALGLDAATVLVCLDVAWIDARRAAQGLWLAPPKPRLGPPRLSAPAPPARRRRSTKRVVVPKPRAKPEGRAPLAVYSAKR